MLKVLVVAYIASELGALIHGMLLELSHGLPDNHALPIVLVALVWKFTEVDAVGQHLIDVLHEVSPSVAARALDVLWVLILFQLNLTVFTEQLIAIFALEGLVWEVTTHHTEDFFSHLALKFVLNLIHLDVQLGNRLRAHNSVNGLVANHHV